MYALSSWTSLTRLLFFGRRSPVGGRAVLGIGKSSSSSPKISVARGGMILILDESEVGIGDADGGVVFKRAGSGFGCWSRGGAFVAATSA